jgi:hypothetical protein
MLTLTETVRRLRRVDAALLRMRTGFGRLLPHRAPHRPRAVRPYLPQGPPAGRRGSGTARGVSSRSRSVPGSRTYSSAVIRRTYFERPVRHPRDAMVGPAESRLPRRLGRPRSGVGKQPRSAASRHRGQPVQVQYSATPETGSLVTAIVGVARADRRGRRHDRAWQSGSKPRPADLLARGWGTALGSGVPVAG